MEGGELVGPVLWGREYSGGVEALRRVAGAWGGVGTRGGRGHVGGGSRGGGNAERKTAYYSGGFGPQTYT